MLGITALALAGGFLVGLADAAEAPRYYAPETPAAEMTPPGRGPAETVLARPRPDYDPIGIDAGGFRVFPTGILSGGYDSNIFRTENDTRSDLITVIRPRLQLRSDFNQHRLDLTVEAAAGFYAEEDSENFFDYRGDIRGHVDILRGLRLEAALTGEHGHEDRGSVDFGAGAEPTEFDRLSALAVLAMRSGRFRYRLGLGGTVLDYEDVPMVGGGTLNNDDRDRFRTDIFARASMDLGPSYRIFLRGAYDQNDFDAALDDTGLNRDSSGYSVVSGLEYDAGGLWFARGYAGWREQRFEDSTLSSVSGFVFGGEVTANITPLTTVSAAADRDIVDTAQAGSSSFWNNTAQLRADHELLRSLIISAALRSRVDQFRGIDRTDRHLGGGVALRWLMSRHVWLTLDYDIDQRSSTGSQEAQNFLRNAVFLRAVLQP